MFLFYIFWKHLLVWNFFFYMCWSLLQSTVDCQFQLRQFYLSHTFQLCPSGGKVIVLFCKHIKCKPSLTWLVFFILTHWIGIEFCHCHLRKLDFTSSWGFMAFGVQRGFCLAAALAIFIFSSVISGNFSCLLFFHSVLLGLFLETHTGALSLFWFFCTCPCL